jgi:hypothetical protein
MCGKALYIFDIFLALILVNSSTVSKIRNYFSIDGKNSVNSKYCNPQNMIYP